MGLISGYFGIKKLQRQIVDSQIQEAKLELEIIRVEKNLLAGIEPELRSYVAGDMLLARQLGMPFNLDSSVTMAKWLSQWNAMSRKPSKASKNAKEESQE